MTQTLDAQAELQRLLTPMGCDYKIGIEDDRVTLTINDGLYGQLYKPIRKIALRNGVYLVVNSDDYVIT